MARLLVIQGPWQGLELPLARGAQVLGRGEECALAIPDGALSREHCRILGDDETWQVEDLGSRNGISVNGERVAKSVLKPGDLLALGRNLLRFIDDDESALVARAGGATATIQVDAFSAALDEKWQAEHYAALLELSDKLLRVVGTAELEQLLSRWLLARTRARRAVVYRRRGERLLAVGSSGSGTTPTTALDADTLLSLAGEGRATWVSLDGGRGGQLLLPLGKPAELVFLLDGISGALSERDLRLCAFAGRLAYGQMLAFARADDPMGPSADAREPMPEVTARSPAMTAIKEFIDRVSRVDSTVLLLGESGSGKELVAREIHRRSGRSNAPFVAVNCGAIPETLVESELFGHEKGAFTGATERRAGKFERANHGTLFLDEIGDLSTNAQAKLLRVLEDRVVEPVGGTGPIPVDVRIVAATHRDLKEMSKNGTFREDLYYRLSVLVAGLPPLRDRTEDVSALAVHFLESLRGAAGRDVEGIAPAALEALERYEWPGNVRELRNVVERAVILGRGDHVELADLPLEIRTAKGQTVDERSGDWVKLPLAIQELERLSVMAALRVSEGNKSQAARILGIDRATLYSRLKQYGVEDG